MTYWLPLILVFVLFLGCFIYACLPEGRWRIAGVTTYILLIVVIFAGAFSLLGQPKPIKLEWRMLAGSQVKGLLFKEGESIFIWVLIDGEPITYRLPWNMQDAQALQDAMNGAGKDGGTVELGPRIDGLPDAPTNGEIAKQIPPEKLPDKTP